MTSHNSSRTGYRSCQLTTRHSTTRSHDPDAYVNNCRSSSRLFVRRICTLKLDCIVVDATLRHAVLLHVKRQSRAEVVLPTLFCNNVMDVPHVARGMRNVKQTMVIISMALYNLQTRTETRGTFISLDRNLFHQARNLASVYVRACTSEDYTK